MKLGWDEDDNELLLPYNFKTITMKNILLSIFLLGVTLSCAIDRGKLSGVVTYKDSYTSPNQADAACEIYAISEAAALSSQYSDIYGVIGNFQVNKSIYSNWVNTTMDPGRIKKAKDQFDTSSNFTFRYIRGFRQLPAIARTSANATGNYSLSLKPGKYYILFVSGNVKGKNTAEINGNIDFKLVDIKSTTEVLLNVNFEKPENRMIMYITGWQRNGC